MTKQPDVIQKSISEDELTAELKVPEDLVYTEGHFENHPIVPGVVLLDWAIDLSMESFPALSSPEELNQLKFRKPLQPGDQCTLQITVKPDENKLSFTFVDGETTFATGWCTIEFTRKDQ